MCCAAPSLWGAVFYIAPTPTYRKRRKSGEGPGECGVILKKLWQKGADEANALLTSVFQIRFTPAPRVIAPPSLRFFDVTYDSRFSGWPRRLLTALALATIFAASAMYARAA